MIVGGYTCVRRLRARAAASIAPLAPIEWPNPDQKDDLRASWKEPIRGMIQEEWKKGKP